MNNAKFLLHRMASNPKESFLLGQNKLVAQHGRGVTGLNQERAKRDATQILNDFYLRTNTPHSPFVALFVCLCCSNESLRGWGGEDPPGGGGSRLQLRSQHRK